MNRPFLLALLCAARSVFAAWPTDAGQNVLVANVQQYVAPQPMLAPDGLGGFFVAWSRSDGTGVRTLRGDHFAADATRLWPIVQVSDGGLAGRDVLGSSPGDYQGNSRTVSDDQGGFIDIYAGGSGGGPWSVNAQRFDDAGTPLWTAGPFGGRELFSAAVGGTSFQAIPDGLGGTIVAYPNVAGNMVLQRIDSAGAFKYSATGRDLGMGQGTNILSGNLAADGDGGVYYLWPQTGSQSQPGALAHVDSSGAVLFMNSTVAPQQTSFNQWAVAAQRDVPGVWAGWLGVTNPQRLYLQHFQSDGAALLTDGGAPGGIVLATLNTLQSDVALKLLNDGAGGVVAIWYDAIGGQGTIMASHFGPDGSPLWNGQPNILSAATTAPGYPNGNVTFRPFVTHDGAVVVIWAGPGWNNLYGEKVRLGDGAALWGPNSGGILITTVLSPTWFDAWVGDDNGVTLAFNNYYPAINDVLLMHVRADGTLGDPAGTPDAGAGVDAGTDAGTATDSGVQADAGTPDAGGGSDAGQSQGGDGGGQGHDAGATGDAGTGSPTKGGCGCTTGGPETLAWALALMAAGLRRRARRT